MMSERFAEPSALEGFEWHDLGRGRHQMNETRHHGSMAELLRQPMAIQNSHRGLIENRDRRLIQHQRPILLIENRHCGLIQDRDGGLIQVAEL